MRITVDIFDHLAEAKQGTPTKVAVVQSDGQQGSLTLLDHRFEAMLRPLFTDPKRVLVGGPGAGDGVKALGPWTEEALRYLVNLELRVHNLRGVLQVLP